MNGYEDELNLIADYISQNQFAEGDSGFKGQWEELTDRCSFIKNALFRDQLNLYNQRFEHWIEFRSLFAGAIEKINWHVTCNDGSAIGNISIEQAQTIIADLQKEIKFFSSNNQNAESVDADKWWTTLDKVHAYHPVKFVEAMQNMLIDERSLISFSSQLPEFLFTTFAEREKHIDKDLCFVEVVAKGFVSSVSEVSAYITDYNYFGGQMQNPFDIQLSNGNVTNQAAMEFLETKLLAVVGDKKKMLVEISSVWTKVKDELGIWRRGQAYANNGLIFANNNIEILETWIKRLFQVMRSSIETIGNLIATVQLSPLGNSIDSLENGLQQYVMMITDLIKSSLVVDKHPPQVLKTKTHFDCRARHLLSEELNFHQIPPQASLNLITAEDADEVRKGRNPQRQTITLVKPSEPKCLIVVENNTPRVTFSWNSLNRGKLDVSKEIPLHLLLENLEGIWRKNCEPSFNVPGLDDHARKLIIKKIYGRTDVDLSTYISWMTLYNEKSLNKEFTFWKYFSQIMALTANPAVKELWNSRRLVGFAERKESENMLKECKMGTFLLRFSQFLWGGKERAGLVLSCIDDKAGVPEFGHYSPYTTKDLELHNLSDIIHSMDGKYHNLKFLYPNIPKETVFGLKSQSSAVSSKGYLSVNLSSTSHLQ